MTVRRPSVTPLRTLTTALVTIASLTIAAAAFGANPVVRVGDYSNVTTTDDGSPSGFTLSLWRDGADLTGLITFVDGKEHYSHTSLIRQGTLVDDTGALTLTARLTLDARREESGQWGRAMESIEFVGTLEGETVSGRFAVIRHDQDERTFFEDQSVTLNRVPSTGPSSYPRYGDWLAAHEHLIGTREIAVAEREKERQAGRALQVGLSGGLFATSGLDARYFESGGGHFTTDVYYTFRPHIAVGARMGLSRFYPSQTAVGRDVIPGFATDPVLKVPETGFLFELAPGIRVTSGNIVTDRVTGFVQASAGYYYVNMETPYSLQYMEGVRRRVENGSIGHIGHRVGGSVAGGISVKLSRSSRMEIAPEYHHVFGDSDLSLYGIMIHFRVEFLHD